MICIEDTEDAFITRVIAVPVLAVEAAADLADLAALERAVLLVLLQGVFHLRRVDLPTARFGAFDRPEDALLELGDTCCTSSLYHYSALGTRRASAMLRGSISSYAPCGPISVTTLGAYGFAATSTTLA